MSKKPLFGVGFYTLSEASRLTGANPTAIRRWVSGYYYKHGYEEFKVKPLWHASLYKQGNILNITFADLIELLLVNSFRKHGVTWHELRAASNFAAKEFSHDRPFSSFKFKTDGKRMLAEYAQENGLERLLEITKNNYAMRDILALSIKDELEFAGNNAIRWYPSIVEKKAVVLDPNRAFGLPIVDSFGVPTDVLAKCFAVEKSYKEVADWYQVDKAAVKWAVEFERKLAA